jgi:AmmeMemoRadiSam system protein B
MMVPLLLALLLQTEAARPFPSDHGYAATPEHLEAVVAQSARHPVPEIATAPLPDTPPLVLVCPHDDHSLAGPVYLPVMQKIRAPRLILLGVAHRAEKWKAGSVLIFDDHTSWASGALGGISVDPVLRSELLKALATENVLISNGHHAEEHSIEAFVPWLRKFDCGSKIVPILVPSMSWERMEGLASNLADAMASIAMKRNWEMGKDVQVLISNDATHYGDQGWGGKNHAPYGIGCEGLAGATANDRRLIATYLEGPLQAERLKGLLYELVEEGDLTKYKVTWCGRFAVPFGLEFTRRLAEKMGMPVPEGKLLAYSTSVELGQLEVEGLEPTAPSNLRHWVGYAAMGWWVPVERP